MGSQSHLAGEMALKPFSRTHAAKLGLTVLGPGPIRSCLARNVEFVRSQNVWVEIPLPGRWTAAFRVLLQNDQPVVGELRLFPAESDTPAGRRPPGEWSGICGHPMTRIPPSGVTARLLRTIRTQTFNAVLRACLAKSKWGGSLPIMLQPYAPPPKPLRMSARGRKGRTDGELAKMAAEYVRANLHDRPPVAAVATRFRLSLSKARDVVKRARTRGLLSPAEKQGRRGGFLTRRALVLLAYPKPTTPIAQRTKRRTRHGSKR